jgi:hypothetical protein
MQNLVQWSENPVVVDKPKRVRKPRAKKSESAAPKAKSKPRSKSKSVVSKSKKLAVKSKAIKKKPVSTKTGTVIKRFSSSWIHFCNEMRRNPIYNDLKFSEKNKVFSPIWHALSDEEKQKYKNMHNEDKARFKREFLALTPEKAKELNAIKRARRKKRREEHKDEPKKTSAYMLFVQHERSAIKEKFIKEKGREPTFPELGAYMGSMWHSLPASDREKYAQLYRTLMSERKPVSQ